MTRVEAVTDLRRFLSRYSKLNCRTDGSSPTSKSPELGRSGLRVKVYPVCDFVNESGSVTTEHFPIEIETTPDTLLITGFVALGKNGPLAAEGTRLTAPDRFAGIVVEVTKPGASA